MGMKVTLFPIYNQNGYLQPDSQLHIQACVCVRSACVVCVWCVRGVCVMYAWCMRDVCVVCVSVVLRVSDVCVVYI